MSNAVPAEPTPALVLLQPLPIASNPAARTGLPMPHEVVTQNPALAFTRTSIAAKLSDSGKKWTYTAKVFTLSGWTPTGTVMFQDGLKVLCPEAPLSHGIATFKVKADEVNGVVTATYRGDCHHAASSAGFMTIASTVKAEPSVPTQIGVPREVSVEHTPAAVPYQAAPIAPNPVRKASRHAETSKLSLTHPPISNETCPKAAVAEAQNDPAEEVALEHEFVALWQKCKKAAGTLLRTKHDVRLGKDAIGHLQFELDRVLHEYKQQLVKTGRNGRWTPFLRRQDISRATADRWVNRHELRVNPKPVIGPNEALSGPTEKDVTALVKKVVRLTLVLTTPDSVAQFLCGVTAVLQPPTSAA